MTAYLLRKSDWTGRPRAIVRNGSRWRNSGRSAIKLHRRDLGPRHGFVDLVNIAAPGWSPRFDHVVEADVPQGREAVLDADFFSFAVISAIIRNRHFVS